tara:strand:+ start:90 stop:869 length:780 start_codon:yes stop_codon:yes gene_type:complete
MEKPLKIQEEIINQARKLDKSRNQDALRVAKRNKGHFIREMIEQLLLDIRSISPQKREKECEMNVFLSLSDTMEDDREMRIQETQSVTRKFFLEKIGYEGFLRVLIQDLYDTVDKESELPIGVRLAKISFVPSKLEPRLIKAQKEYPDDIFDKKIELRVVGNKILYGEDKVFTLRGKRKPLFELLSSEAEVIHSEKKTKNGARFSIEEISQKTKYASESLRGNIYKLQKSLNNKLKPFKIEVKIDARSRKYGMHIIYSE